MKLELFANYFQSHLQDDDQALGNLADAWTEDATQRLRIAVAPGVVGVGTARNDTVVAELEVTAVEPALNAALWEHVVEADLHCATGRIVIAGCTDYFPDARRLNVDRGKYRVRVLYGAGTPGYDNAGDELAYRIQLWPTVEAQPVAVVKQGPIPWAG